jgi:hypothetical protein
MGLNSSKPLKEQIRENKREINRAVRELERERVKLERQEEKLKGDITKAAKESQVVSALFVPFSLLFLGPFRPRLAWKKPRFAVITVQGIHFWCDLVRILHHCV